MYVDTLLRRDILRHCTIVLHQLYKGNVLSVQECTRLPFVKDFNQL